MPLASAARGTAPQSDGDGVGFTLSSSLPPMVAGAVMGEMELSVPFLHPKPGVLCPTRYLRDRQREPLFAVRMLWWGDDGPGTVLKPGVLSGRDKRGERARRDALLSKATCALFPVRCGLDGLTAYLKDMGKITLDVLVHEGDSRGARHVGRCAIPVGGWGGQLEAPHGSRDRSVVAEGYFPVLSLDGSKYAGDLQVRLRSCLGPSSLLCRVLAAAKMAAGGASMGRETQAIVKMLGGGTAAPSIPGQREAVSLAGGRLKDRPEATVNRAGITGEGAAGGLPARASFDSDDLSGRSNAGSPTASKRLPKGSAPVSSFQLNEALARFDASDTLPVWPTPKGSLYHPPESHGEAPPMPRDGQASRGRLTAAKNAGAERRSSPVSKAHGRGSRSSPTRVSVALTGTARVPGMIGSVSPEKKAGHEGIRKQVPSVSPERQAPEPNSDVTERHPDSCRGGDRRSRPESPAPPPVEPTSPLLHEAAASKDKPNDDGGYLSELLNRGKELRDKMSFVVEDSEPPPAPTTSPQPVAYSLPVAGTNRFVDLATQPGLVSGAPLGSSLRDDIEGIFDTLSDTDFAVDEAGVLVRDANTRGHEDRVVDLLLEAAGPPPSSLAFPALAIVERRRADSLARARFLRIRLSRLVMFGSIASAPEGHGWQLRFRLPAFATLPARGTTGNRAGGRNASAGRGETWDSRVVSLPVPPRVPTSSLGKGKAVRRGRPTSGTAGSSASVLRVRRGFGASDLVVGETSVMEEIVCAVDVDDACVRQWMDVGIEFLLVDGKSDGALRARAGQSRNTPHLRKKQERTESSTVGPGDRVVAVATLPLRDLLLSADLGVVSTLDLTEVSDFWAAEDARAAAAGHRGRGGRALRNPYRTEAAGAARPLVLGDRAIGALAVALELVPGEADDSPEHSRPEVERGFARRRYHGVEQTGREDSVLSASSRLARPVSGAQAEASSRPPLVTSEKPPSVGELGAWEPNATGEQKENATHKEDINAGTRRSPPPDPSPDVEEGLAEPKGAMAAVHPEMDSAVVLRLNNLALSPGTGTGVEQVRVAYSFTQVEGDTPTVTHRSVRGSRTRLPDAGRDGRPVPPFVFAHMEIFPAPADCKSWRVWANTSRVFEVWGWTEGRESYGAGPGEALLGLAKVSLQPFAAFACGGEGPGGAEARAGSLAVAADGPVVVVDPFSGRAVGELRVFLALGAASYVATLLPRGEETEGVGQGATGVAWKNNGGAANEGLERKARDRREKSGGEWEGGGERGGGDGDDLGELATQQQAPALDDSLAELSMLLNPGRTEGPKVDIARSSGDFTGLVRHVIELSVVGELPVALDAEAIGDSSGDEPVGCSIEYSLPSGQASLDLEVGWNSTPPTTAQTHELWWDADSGILNSRARHTVKVPGGTPDARAAGTTVGVPADNGGKSSLPQDGALRDLLDCMFGREDLALSLFWSAGAAAGQREPASRSKHSHGDDGADAKQGRRPLGTTVLRRADLLLLVSQKSARAVLNLPIEVASGSGGGGTSLPPPKMLPLSVSYRREPSAVARRKSRGWAGRRGEDALAAGGRRRDRGKEHESQDLDASCHSESAFGDCTGEGGLSRGEVSLVPNRRQQGREDGDEGKQEEDDGKIGDVSPSGLRRVGAPERSAAVPGRSVGAGSPDSWDNGGESSCSTLIHRSSRTEHLLPAHTTVCIRVESIDLMSDVQGSGGQPDADNGALVWASFEFPWPDGGGRDGRKHGGVFVWKEDGGGDEDGDNVHWSPAVAMGLEGGRGRMALAWNVELPIIIDAAFVDFVHTQFLEIHVWRGDRDEWPRAGTALGKAKVALNSLLVTLGGIGGDVNISPAIGRGYRAGRVAVRLFFKHRGLGSRDEPAMPDDGGEGKRGGQKDAASEGDGFERVPPALLQDDGCEPSERKDPCDSSPPLSSVRVPESVTNASDQASEGAPRAEPEPRARRQPTAQLAATAGGKLEVHIERAMRLLSTVPGDSEAGVSSEGALPSTYVTFRWEEGGKPPLRPVLVLRAAISAGEEFGKGKDGQAAQASCGEAVTPVVENSSNPIFNHAAELCVTDPEAWGRVCGPSAALVFRVWRRARRGWWDAPRTLATATDPVLASDDGGDSGRGLGAARDTVAADSRFGDKLIGCAVVGLAVLRRAVTTRGGPRLREIDGWYHVLDDLQRPHGQIKVQVRPLHPAPESDQNPQTSEQSSSPPSPPPAEGAGGGRLLAPPPYRPWPAVTPSEYNSEGGRGSPKSSTDATPPLHDTQAHLRAVHAFLDSLPAEFRSEQPRTQPPPPTVSTSSIPLENVPDFTSASQPAAEEVTEGPGATPSFRDAMAGPGGAAGEEKCSGGEQSSLPELRRMLSSLEKVDRRLFALGPSGGASVSEGNESLARVMVEGGAGDGSPSSRTAKSNAPSEGVAIAGDAEVARADSSRDTHLAASRLQQAWRIRSRRRKEAAAAAAAIAAAVAAAAAAAVAQARREASAQRHRRRDEAAARIQLAYRRAQARHRLRAAAQERRRWEARLRRRVAACATIERAWDAFERRRRATRELAEARARASAVAEAERRAKDAARGATRIQAVWRGRAARAAARRSRASRAACRAQEQPGDGNVRGAVASLTPIDGSNPAPAADACRMGVIALPTPSTFYNQLSQDPRRRHWLPDAHLAAMAALPAAGPRPARALAASHGVGVVSSEEAKREGGGVSEGFGPRPLARSAGVARTPRFADLETARIARIMKGNLQHWAGVRSGGCGGGGSSSSEDCGL